MRGSGAGSDRLISLLHKCIQSVTLNTFMRTEEFDTWLFVLDIKLAVRHFHGQS